MGEEFSGVQDCSCCGMTVMTRKCESCASGDCDPDVTWHCSQIGGECDGTVCETHEGAAPESVQGR